MVVGVVAGGDALDYSDGRVYYACHKMPAKGKTVVVAAEQVGIH